MNFIIVIICSWRRNTRFHFFIHENQRGKIIIKLVVNCIIWSLVNWSALLMALLMGFQKFTTNFLLSIIPKRSDVSYLKFFVLLALVKLNLMDGIESETLC